MRIKLYEVNMEFNNPLSSKRFAPKTYKSISNERNTYESDVKTKIADLDSALKKITELEAEIKRLQSLLESTAITNDSKLDKPVPAKDERFDETIDGGNNV